jgi:quinol monooxygenase YgiN
MYGTVARFRTLPGKEKSLMDLGEQMSKEPVSGQIGEYIFKLDSGDDEFIVVALFSDRESYHRYAQSPESDQNYRKMRELLAADPEWNDGEVVQEFHHT